MSLFKKLQHLFGFPERKLIHAASVGDLAQVQALLADGADVNARRKDGYTALMLAAKGGHDAVVTAFCQHPGLDLNATAKDGATALILASVNDHPCVVKTLAAAGADINSPAGGDGTALMWASFAGQAPTVLVLQALGADANAKSSSGETALMWASYGLHLDVVEALMAGRGDVNARANQTGWTPLMFAVFGASLGLDSEEAGKIVVQALLKAAADVHLQSAAGYTALSLAKGIRLRELIKTAGGYRPGNPTEPTLLRAGGDEDAKLTKLRRRLARCEALGALAGDQAEILRSFNHRRFELLDEHYRVSRPG